MTHRPTLRRGATGPHVAAWQGLIGARADGAFGPATEAATRAFQAAHGLVDDGVVGERSWRAAGETWAPVATPGDPRAPACVAAMRDANAAWPERRRASDGIMADALHAATSDHAVGNAYDLTHDPDAGCDGNQIALMAMGDPRTKYIIWNRRIWSRARAAEGWRKYTGRNGHTHHCHVSVETALRDDASPWPWAP